MAMATAGVKVLGTDPATGDEITLRNGRFGAYVQQGEGEKPKRSSVAKPLVPGEITLEQALGLLRLPREVAIHPETKQPILAGIGRFGPYVQHAKSYANIGKDEDILEIGANRAIDLIIAKESGLSGRRFGKEGAGASRSLGEHPDGGSVTVKSGRYGPYVSWGKINATLPRDADPTSFTLDEAVALFAAKGEAGAGQARILGKHPSGGDILLRDGRFGPYVSHGKINATLRNGLSPETVTLDDAIRLIDEKQGRHQSGRAAKRQRRNPSQLRRSRQRPHSARRAKLPAIRRQNPRQRDPPQPRGPSGREDESAAQNRHQPGHAKEIRCPRPTRVVAIAVTRGNPRFLDREQGPSKIGKREIARAFRIKGADRIALKRMLKDLEDEGAIERRRKQLHKPGQLPSVVLADIASRDADGELIATPVEWDAAQGPAPKIILQPGRRRPGMAVPGVGDRALMRTEIRRDAGPGEPAYSGRIVKLLERAKILSSSASIAPIRAAAAAWFRSTSATSTAANSSSRREARRATAISLPSMFCASAASACRR